MRHLLAKDLRLIAPYLWLIVPAHALWCVQAFLTAELYFWMSLAAALAWTVAVAMIEWRFDADRLVASLPVTRAAVVKARYASALAGLALGAVLFVVYGHAVMAVATRPLTERWPGTPAWASMDGVMAFLAVGYVLLIGFLPFYFRVGLPLGATLFVVSAGVAVFAATVLVRAGGSAGRLAEGAGSASAALPWSEAVRGWLVWISDAWGPGPASLAVLVSAALVGLLSVRLSIRFYERREL